jgi:hypothetical protein
MPINNNLLDSENPLRTNSLNNSFLLKKSTSNNIIISSHMMKQLGGGLPGQKVYQWDRLNEYKIFHKKINNDISEIEVEENESILSKESNSMINKNFINTSKHKSLKPKSNFIVNQFETSLIKENKEMKMSKSKDVDMFNENIHYSKLNYEKNRNENLNKLKSENKLSLRKSPVKNSELNRAMKSMNDLEK